MHEEDAVDYNKALADIRDAITRPGMPFQSLGGGSIGDLTEAMISIGEALHRIVGIAEQLVEIADAPGPTAVGKCFHVKGDATLQYQGYVKAKIAEGYYLVQYFSWLDGNETTQRIVGLSEMKDWIFYDSDEDMRQAARENNTP